MRQAVLIALSACGFQGPPAFTGTAKDGGADGKNRGVDGRLNDGASVDQPGGSACSGPTGWSVCLSAPAAGTPTINGDLDTDTDPRCASTQLWTNNNQPASCFIIGGSIVVDSVTVHGNRPLVLVATTTITINTLLDVSSHRGGMTGPGTASCTAFPQQPGTSGGGSGGGGGAGASFMTKGGDGGTGEASASARGTAPPQDTAAPSLLRAGCPGQVGANGGRTPGEGGGAVYLVANTSITGSVIDASGAGAVAGGIQAGGSGGGSGGMIVMSAPSIAVATVMANGGGGSSGGNDGGGGQVGSDPNRATPTVQASGGGTGARSGGKGQAGSMAATAGSGGPGSGDAGGGGGGGAGSIRTTVTPIGVVTPAPTALP